MGKVNYQEIKTRIRNRQEFKGNSCKAYGNVEKYEVYSYTTLIYKENFKENKKELNTNYYSVTTSKIQGIIAEVIYSRTLKQLRKTKAKELQKIDYSQLYYDKEVRVEKDGIAQGREIDLDIKLNDFNYKADCQIGHFGYNFFVRTNAGIHFKRYSTRTRLQRAVENKLQKEGFTVIKWVDKTK